MSRRSIPWAIVAALSPCAAPTPSPPLPHDAYVWQRRWTPALESALRQSNPRIAAWRVLAGEWSASTRFEADPPVDLLRRSGRPVIPVFRLTGGLDADVPGRIATIAHRWRASGLDLSAVEIDHDCPESQLPPYRGFLRALRRKLPGWRLSITALPAWLGHRDLPALLGEADEAVLQVHAVMNPRRGLFEVRQAAEWIRRWSAITPVPFRVALPNYGSRVSWNETGQVTAIESETPRYGADTESRELFATPAAVARLLTSLRVSPPAQFAGVAWFRLPSPEDRRAWSLTTWHAVIDGRPLRAALSASLARSSDGARDILVANQGAVDAELPPSVTVTARACQAADALAPYGLLRTTTGAAFRRAQSRLLRAGETRVVGWVRCSEDVHVVE